jgi:hypothetical protein
VKKPTDFIKIIENAKFKCLYGIKHLVARQRDLQPYNDNIFLKVTTKQQKVLPKTLINCIKNHSTIERYSTYHKRSFSTGPTNFKNTSVSYDKIPTSFTQVLSQTFVEEPVPLCRRGVHQTLYSSYPSKTGIDICIDKSFIFVFVEVVFNYFASFNDGFSKEF